MPLDGTVRRRARKPAAGLAAMRVYDAQTGRRDAEKEWDLALAGAVKAGVIPDHLASPEPAGTNRVVYADDSMQISLSVVAPIVGINFAGFVAGLVKAEVDPKLIARLTRKHRTETRPAHRFTSSLVG